MKVAFRLDDVSPSMNWDSFQRLVDIFRRFGVKPLLGVIPDNQDVELLKWPTNAGGWEELRRLRDSGWLTAQHGYRHVYTTADPGLLGINRYSEFAGVDAASQEDMLRRGQLLLKEQGLGTDIFMAPAHSYDANTLRALRALGFRYVTDGYGLFPYTRFGLKFIPCQSSRPRRAPAGLITVCLHPNTMTDSDFAGLESWVKANRDTVIDYSGALGCAGLGPVARLSEAAVLMLRKAQKHKDAVI